MDHPNFLINLFPFQAFPSASHLDIGFLTLALFPPGLHGRTHHSDGLNAVWYVQSALGICGF